MTKRTTSNTHRKQARARIVAQHDSPFICFTIPSLYDDTVLDCRIYHPGTASSVKPTARSTSATSSTSSTPDPSAAPTPVDSVLHGAIVAHPYGPLGGSYHDPVVLLAVETLVSLGRTVATFNFRGAGGSQGSTSWSGRPEVGDYCSVIGLLERYLQTVAAGSGVATDEPHAVELILAGYSYGSLIVSMLPSTDAILGRFREAEKGTAAAEILLRAEKLAAETLRLEAADAAEEVMSGGGSQRGRDSLRPEAALGKGRPVTAGSCSGERTLIVGGEETAPEVRSRSSREHSGRRSLDAVARMSLEAVPVVRRVVRRMGSHGTAGSGAIAEDDEGTARSEKVGSQQDDGGRHVECEVRTRYLLISPLLPPLSAFLNLSASSWMPHRLRGWLHHSTHTSDHGDGEVSYDKFTANPTLVVFGSGDGFTSGDKLSHWARGLQQAPSSAAHFEWLCVPGAGHFWREMGAADALVSRIESWV